MFTMLLSFFTGGKSPFWLKILGAAILASMVIGGVWYVVHSYNEGLREEGRQEVQAVFDKYKADQEALALKLQREQIAKEASIRKLEIEAAKKAELIRALTNKELDNEIRTKVVYRDCKLPANGVQLYNSAAAGK